MNKWAKRLIGAALALAALAADSLISIRLAGGASLRAVSASSHTEDPQDALSAFRLEREQLRARSQAQLNEVIYSDAGGDDAPAQARRQLMDMLDRAEKETTIEGVLRARGFEDAVATVGANSANVLVRREALTQRESAVILELVMRETGLTGGNVKIIPVK